MAGTRNGRLGSCGFRVNDGDSGDLWHESGKDGIVCCIGEQSTKPLVIRVEKKVFASVC